MEEIYKITSADSKRSQPYHSGDKNKECIHTDIQGTFAFKNNGQIIKLHFPPIEIFVSYFQIKHMLESYIFKKYKSFGLYAKHFPNLWRTLIYGRQRYLVHFDRNLAEIDDVKYVSQKGIIMRLYLYTLLYKCIIDFGNKQK